MTRFIHDQFAKDYLEQLLTPYGEVQAARRVAGEVRQIVTIHQLPCISETLWLRIIGRGKFQNINDNFHRLLLLRP
ncbi:hypothetical protein [Nostoc sp. PCC 9305]|uniref:hypothetical protein n=1 Tax=Nostoc sp. PCC 9305 TaxID=296636 RepID=UPI0039C5AD08